MPLIARLPEHSQRLPRHFFAILLFFVAVSGTLIPAARAQSAAARVPVITVDTTPAHMLNSFDPDRALGSSVDVLSHSGIDQVYTPHILQESLSAGWGPITYRNNTELRMAAWHWTENGTWSDAAHKSGYFTGSTDLKEPTRYILAYALPHRGFSTSGDRPVQAPNLTYWKSNPYLTSKFTGESDALASAMGRRRSPSSQQPVSAVRIAWADPFAVTYQVEYWVGEEMLSTSTTAPKANGRRSRPASLKNAKGGSVTLKLSDAPVTTQFIRVLMTESSNTCDQHGSSDVRNCVGYAIQEMHAGSIDAVGSFIDIPKDATGEEPAHVLLLFYRSLALRRGRQRDRKLPAHRLRSFLHQRHHQQPARDDSDHHALRHARRFRRADRLHREARLPDRLHRNGRRARRQARHARRLRRSLHPVGRRSSQGRSPSSNSAARFSKE